jgi:DNA-binding response OmpR family regulator
VLAEEFQPHLILLDVSIPGKDGFLLAEELAAGDQTSSIPPMSLTAMRAGDGRARAQDVGCSAYLETPVKTSTLLWKIKALLEKH